VVRTFIKRLLQISPPAATPGYLQNGQKDDRFAFANADLEPLIALAVVTLF
jgi:hypothetical protein